MNKSQSSNQRRGGGNVSGGVGGGNDRAAEERIQLGLPDDIDEDFDNIDPHSDDAFGMRARMSSF